MDNDTKKTAERRATLEAVLAITMESLVKPPEPEPEPEPEDMDPLKREKLLEDHYATRAYLENWRKERGKI